MEEKNSNDEAMDWLEAELADSIDEDYELELSDAELSMEIPPHLPQDPNSDNGSTRVFSASADPTG